jgi:hypothetical protein
MHSKLPKERADIDEMFTRIPKFGVKFLRASAFEDKGLRWSQNSS